LNTSICTTCRFCKVIFDWILNCWMKRLGGIIFNKQRCGYGGRGYRGFAQLLGPKNKKKPVPIKMEQRLCFGWITGLDMYWIGNCNTNILVFVAYNNCIMYLYDWMISCYFQTSIELFDSERESYNTSIVIYKLVNECCWLCGQFFNWILKTRGIYKRFGDFNYYQLFTNLYYNILH